MCRLGEPGDKGPVFEVVREVVAGAEVVAQLAPSPDMLLPAITLLRQTLLKRYLETMMLGELGPLDLTGSTTVSSRDSDTDTQLSPARWGVSQEISTRSYHNIPCVVVSTWPSPRPSWWTAATTSSSRCQSRGGPRPCCPATRVARSSTVPAS